MLGRLLAGTVVGFTFLTETAAQAPTLTPSSLLPEVTIQYDEPTLNADGSPLTNLAKTSIFCQIPTEQPEQLIFDEPASQATGGGHVVRVLIVSAVSHRDTVTCRATATNQLGAQSAYSEPVTGRVGKTHP
jgi:hypothetical protein